MLVTNSMHKDNWLTWTPGDPQNMEDPQGKAPAKPTKTNFGGFEGAIPGGNPIFRGADSSPARPPNGCPYTLPAGVRLVRYTPKTPPDTRGNGIRPGGDWYSGHHRSVSVGDASRPPRTPCPRKPGRIRRRAFGRVVSTHRGNAKLASCSRRRQRHRRGAHCQGRHDTP